MFLVPLLLGFAITSASAFTATFTRLWGERGGSLATLVLRILLGMPLWTAGLIMAMRTSTRPLLAPNPATEFLAWVLILAGCLPMVLGLYALGLPAILPSVNNELVARGIYIHVRHPIYAGLLLVFAGLALLSPTLPVISACALGIVWINVHARLEEADLLQRIPAYREYMRRVPRFFPRF